MVDTRPLILFGIFVALTTAENSPTSVANSANQAQPSNGFSVHIPTGLQDLLDQAEATISSWNSLPLFSSGGTVADKDAKVFNNMVNPLTFSTQSESGKKDDDDNYNYFSTSFSYSASVMLNTGSVYDGITDSKLTRALLEIPSTVIPKMQPHLSSLIRSFDDTPLGFFFSGMQHVLENQAEFKDRFNKHVPSTTMPPVDEEVIAKIIDEKLNRGTNSAVEDIKKYVADVSEKVGAELHNVEKVISDKGNELDERLNQINVKFEASLTEVTSSVKAIESAFNQNIEKIDEHLRTVSDIIQRKVQDSDQKMDAFEKLIDEKVTAMDAALTANKVAESKPVESVEPNAQPVETGKPLAKSQTVDRKDTLRRGKKQQGKQK